MFCRARAFTRMAAIRPKLASFTTTTSSLNATTTSNPSSPAPYTPNDPWDMSFQPALATSTSDISPYTIPRQIRPSDEPLENMRRRLLYTSRKRGIQETCLLLSTFAHTHLPLMTTRDQLNEFDAFLAENDWDIYYWATGSRPLPEEWRDSEMVKALCLHAENREKVVLQMPELE